MSARTATAAVLVTGASALGVGAVASAAGAHASAVRVEAASAASKTTLGHLFAKGRQSVSLSSKDIGGMIPGSERLAVDPTTGIRWGVASFYHSASTPLAGQVSLQDGGNTGIFEQRPGHAWQFVAAGISPLGCDTVLPSAVRRAWHITEGISCSSASAATIARAKAAIRAAARSRIAVREDASTDPDGSALGQAIAQLALSQINHPDNPDSQNFQFDCDPYTTMTGPVPPAADNRGCGWDKTFGVEDEGEEWCADFSSWVWQQNGVTEDWNLINAGARSFYAWGVATGNASAIDATDYQVGDAVVFFEPGAVKPPYTTADHVGIITGVNSDGTINMVNGDFGGSGPTIDVQYNQDISLPTWASEVWSNGEQWGLVTPPSGTQPAAPSKVKIAGPHTVVAGQAATFTVSADEPAGVRTSNYNWAFGSGEYAPDGVVTTTTSGRTTHVFADPGPVTVTMTVEASNDTLTTKTFNVDVLAGPSSDATSTPDNSVYYLENPVHQRVFVNTKKRGLVEESYDGASWLSDALPGDFVPGTAVSAIDLKDADSELAPHVFGVAKTGQLAEAWEDGNLAQNAPYTTPWYTQNLPGSPARKTPIAATTMENLAQSSGSVAPYTAVFYYNRRGQLMETQREFGRWVAQAVAAPAADNGTSLAVGTVTPSATGQPRVVLYDANASGRLVATAQTLTGWRSWVSRARVVARGSQLAGAVAQQGATTGVYFIDAKDQLAGATLLAVRTVGSRGASIGGLRLGAARRGAGVTPISAARVSPTGGLQSATAVSSANAPVDELFAESARRVPIEVSQSGSKWTTSTLPGKGTRLLGVTAYPASGTNQQVILSTATSVEADYQASDSGAWTQSALPTTPANLAGRVILYAADSADYSAAKTAATGAGIPASNVIDNYYAAFADANTYDYLVIAVGMPAVDDLYFNPCGWSNPNGTGAGGTPFNEVGTIPSYRLQGLDVIEPAGGATPADTQHLATDLAHYAVNGKLPAGVTSLPAESPYQDECAGSPTGS